MTTSMTTSMTTTVVMVVVMLTLNHVAPAWAFASGNVESQCGTMGPLHETTAQTTTSPYVVTVSSTNFVDGTPITVTVSGSPDFTGFMLQARDINGTILSGFTVQAPNSQIRSCSPQGMAVTQTGDDAKASIAVTWTPTSSVADNVIFMVTVVQVRLMYWVSLPGPVVTRQGKTPITFPNVTSPPPLNISSLVQPVNSLGCGVTKTCMRRPAGCDPVADGNSCIFLALTPLSPAAQQVTVEMSGPDVGYLALGFSNDTWMGQDDVYDCIIVNGNVAIATSYTNGRDYPLSYQDAVLVSSVKNPFSRLADGTLQCVFTLGQPQVAGKVNLSQNYYLFLAHGLVEEGEIEKHDVQPMVSGFRLAPLGSPMEVPATRSNGLVKAHGALMLVAWLSLCSIGVVLARFFKPVWPESKLLGEKVWFQLHRGLMVLAVLVTITAFVIPFCYRLGWSGRVHSVLGCIVMFLALVQPIMSAFRPNPNSPKRPLFNWAHWGVGTSARILSAACLFLGVDMVSLDLPDRWDKLLLMGALLWQLAIEALLEMLGCCGPDKSIRENFEMDSVIGGLKHGKLQHNHSQKLHGAKVALLVLYICGNVAFLIALLVGVGLA